MFPPKSWPLHMSTPWCVFRDPDNIQETLDSIKSHYPDEVLRVDDYDEVRRKLYNIGYQTVVLCKGGELIRSYSLW